MQIEKHPKLAGKIAKCPKRFWFSFLISSSTHNGLYVQCNQSKETPTSVIDPHSE